MKNLGHWISKNGNAIQYILFVLFLGATIAAPFFSVNYFAQQDPLCLFLWGLALFLLLQATLANFIVYLMRFFKAPKGKGIKKTIPCICFSGLNCLYLFAVGYYFMLMFFVAAVI